MGRSRWSRLLLDAWPTGLALLLCIPLVTGSGYPLARDLVFVPRQPWTAADVGLGDSAPRAVPLDAVISVLTHVVDGGLLARVLIPLILAAAGWGTHRLLRRLGTLGRLSAGGLAVWNPYVIERLALGQWALLAGYAALPWLILFAARFRAEQRPHDLGATVAWLGIASLTPTGGLLGTLMTLAQGASRSLRTWWLFGLALVLQLTWIAPSLVGSTQLTSDPNGVGAFVADAEGPGGVLTALVGLGGIWDSRSVPATQESWWAPATAVVVLLALILGHRALREALGPPDLRRLWLVALIGFGLALFPTFPPGAALVRWLVETVPGSGLLRDSQKFLAPFVLLAACSLGALAHRSVRTVAKLGPEFVFAVALVAVPLPLVLVPDAGSVTWPTVTPVTYPVGFERVSRILDHEERGDLVTLPWRSYRQFAWGNGEIASDPAIRWFDRPVVTDDDLRVGDTTIRGESPRGRKLGAALRAGPVVEALADNGVAWALVYRDDPAAHGLDLAGLGLVYSDRDMALYRAPDPAPSQSSGSRGARVVVGVIDSAALAVVLGGVGLVVWRGRRRVRDRSR